MRLRVVLAAQVLGFAIAGPAFADWQAVGVADVGPKRGRDRVEAAFDKPVQQVRFTAQTGDVTCRSINLVFAKGKHQKLADRQLKAGAGDVVDIAGADRVLKRIDFKCSVAAGTKATIDVAAAFAGARTNAAALPVPATGANNVAIQGSQVNTPVADPARAPAFNNNVAIQGSQVNTQGAASPTVVSAPVTVNTPIAGSQANAPAAASGCAATGGAIGALQGQAAQNQGAPFGGIVQAQPAGGAQPAATKCP